MNLMSLLLLKISYLYNLRVHYISNINIEKNLDNTASVCVSYSKNKILLLISY